MKKTPLNRKPLSRGKKIAIAAAIGVGIAAPVVYTVLKRRAKLGQIKNQVDAGKKAVVAKVRSVGKRALAAVNGTSRGKKARAKA